MNVIILIILKVFLLFNENNIDKEYQIKVNKITITKMTKCDSG